MPKFSVIIPLYNKAQHIYNTLICVCQQSYSDFEIIVVNDGSTDNSLEETNRITDQRLRVFDKKNEGVSQTRNFAMRQAKGDFFAFLDADDVWLPNHLHNLNQLITQYPDCGLYCTNYSFDYGNSYSVAPIFPTLPTDQIWQGIVSDFFKASMLYRIAWTSAVAIPRTINSEVGFFNESITLGAGEDTEYWSRIALSKPVAFTKKQTAIYNVDAVNRISKIAASKRKHMTFELFKEHEQHNSSLKKFNDMYRIEYAIRHKMSGNNSLFNYYTKDLDYATIALKDQILLKLPQQVLVALWHIKQLGKQLKQRVFIRFK
ncbi:MAG: glycosyltransferase family 2 protein [Flavobacteriaceae bacterium]